MLIKETWLLIGVIVVGQFKDSVALAEKELQGHRDAFRQAHLEEVEEIRNLQQEMYNQFMLDELFKVSHGVEKVRELIQKYRDQVKVLRDREAALKPSCELFKLIHLFIR